MFILVFKHKIQVKILVQVNFSCIIKILLLFYYYILLLLKLRDIGTELIDRFRRLVGPLQCGPLWLGVFNLFH